jgi:hypothetical protein
MSENSVGARPFITAQVRIDTLRPGESKPRRSRPNLRNWRSILGSCFSLKLHQTLALFCSRASAMGGIEKRKEADAIQEEKKKKNIEMDKTTREFELHFAESQGGPRPCNEVTPVTLVG